MFVQFWLDGVDAGGWDNQVAAPRVGELVRLPGDREATVEKVVWDYRSGTVLPATQPTAFVTCRSA